MLFTWKDIQLFSVNVLTLVFSTKLKSINMGYWLDQICDQDRKTQK